MMKRWMTVGLVLALAGGVGGVAAAQQEPPPPLPEETTPPQTQPEAAPAAEIEAAESVETSEEPAIEPALVETAEERPAAPANLGPLSVGDKAPPLLIEQWIKGDPIAAFEPGRVYLVEFWATWCGPCRDGIPKLTALQARHRDRGLVVLGVSSSEQNGAADVAKFVQQQGPAMDYTVAWDDNGRTDFAWMRASGQGGIPTAFIVNQEGVVAWIGHPTFPKGHMERVLEEVLSGSFDVKAAAERDRKAAEIQRLAQMAWNEGRQMEAMDELARLLELDAHAYGVAGLQRYQGLMFHMQEIDAAYDWAVRLVNEFYKDDADMLREVAWSITASDIQDRRDLDLALEAIHRADDLTGGKDVSVLDTMARVHFMRGEVHEAVLCQARALKLNTSEDRKRGLEIKLEEYTKAAER